MSLEIVVDMGKNEISLNGKSVPIIYDKPEGSYEAVMCCSGSELFIKYHCMDGNERRNINGGVEEVFYGTAIKVHPIGENGSTTSSLRLEIPKNCSVSITK